MHQLSKHDGLTASAIASAVALAWERTHPRDVRRCPPAVALAHGDRSPRLRERSVPAHGKSGAAGDYKPSAWRPRHRHGRGWRIAFGGVVSVGEQCATANSIL